MKSNKSGLLLMELSIALVIFAFCAAVCIKLFYAADVRTRRADELEHAVRISESVAEIIKNGNAAETLKLIYPSSSIAGFEFILEFDSDWIPVEPLAGIAAYAAAASIAADTISTVKVCYVSDGVIKTEVPIFSIDVMGVSAVE